MLEQQKPKPGLEPIEPVEIYSELPANLFDNHKSPRLHWLFHWVEFLLHHFFVLSGSTRIYLIVSFLLFGGTFYAVAPTMVLGTVFFCVSVLISLTLAFTAHAINDASDSKALKIQHDVQEFNTKYSKSLLNKENVEENKEQDSDFGTTGQEDPKVLAELSIWTKIRDMNKSGNFSWLNYRYLLERLHYREVVFWMDTMIVVAACWNITEEILRWKAVLPFASVLTAMGPFWIIFSLSALAAVCYGLKVYYTYCIIKLREADAKLFDENRKVLQKIAQTLNVSVEVDQKFSTSMEYLESFAAFRQNSEILKDQSAKVDPNPKHTFWWSCFAGFFVSTASACILYFAVIPASVPLWSALLFPAICFLPTAYISFRIISALMAVYKSAKQEAFGIQGKTTSQVLRQRCWEWFFPGQEKILEDSKKFYNKEAPPAPLTFIGKVLQWRKTLIFTASLALATLITLLLHTFLPASPSLLVLIGMGIALGICLVSAFLVTKYDRMEQELDRKTREAQDHRSQVEQGLIAALKLSNNALDQARVSLQYSLCKAKHAHIYKQRRNFLEYCADNYCVMTWNALVTIFPSFFILNGICTYLFAFPSVLSCWPLFVFELAVPIGLALYFGYLKFADSEHDSIRNASFEIMKEVEDRIENYVNTYNQVHSQADRAAALKSLGLVEQEVENLGKKGKKERSQAASSSSFKHGTSNSSEKQPLIGSGAGSNKRSDDQELVDGRAQAAY